MEINKKNILNFFDDVWKWLKKYSQKIWKLLKELKIIKVVGFATITISSLVIFIETISIGLIHSDKLKFEEIVNYFFNVKIFDYISSINFHLITGGGYLIDLFFWTILLFLGIYWWNNKNYFKKRWVKVVLGVFLILGITTFLFGFYKSMPKIMIPLEKIHSQLSEREYDREFFKNKIYFGDDDSEVFLDRGGEKMYFHYINSRF